MKMLQAVLVITLAFVVPVKAAIIHLNLDFTASGFGAGAPVDPVTGSFSVTFDNSAFIPDTTAGLAATINIPVASAIGFLYEPFMDRIFIGGLQDGVVSIQLGTDDFGIAVDNVSTNPTFASLSYAQSGFDTFFSAAQGSVTPAPVPEPGSLVLLAGGLGLLGLIRRPTQKTLPAIHRCVSPRPTSE